MIWVVHVSLEVNVLLQGDVWICMEVMDSSLDKFYQMVYKQGKSIPEDKLTKIAFAVSTSDKVLIYQLFLRTFLVLSLKIL